MSTGKSGAAGSTPSGKSERVPEANKPAGPAPVEAAKKFEEILKDGKKKGETSVNEGKKDIKEGSSVFDSHHQRVIPTVSKQPGLHPSTHQAVQSAFDKLKGQTKSGGDMKISREGKEGKIDSKGDSEEGGLKAQIFGKSDKVQTVQGKKEGSEKEEGEGKTAEEKIKVELTPEGEGEFKIKVNKGPEIPSVALEAQQPAIKGPLGQNLASPTQQAGPSAAVKEMTELASAMMGKMRILVSGTEAAPGKEVRIPNMGDINPNLKNVDVVIKRDGGTLNVEFLTKNVDAGNYLNQNKEGLNAALRNGLSDIKEIRIDIEQSRPDTQKDDSQGQSRGRRDREQLDEEEQQL